MHQHRLSRTQAFDVLRAASQDSNRKLVDLALEVVDTGTLSIRGWPAHAQHDLRSDEHSEDRPPLAPGAGRATSLSLNAARGIGGLDRRDRGLDLR